MLEIDRRCPWVFFYGAMQQNFCGGGALLFLSDSHWYEISVGLGEGLNNFAELLSLKILLLFAMEKGCRKLNVFGDSLNMINWIKGIQICRVLLLQNLFRSIGVILCSFASFSCQHIYRENKEKADQASKRGLLLDEGIWRIREHLDGVISEYFHPSLFD